MGYQTTLRDLDPEVARLWVEALESGKYEQGRGVLQTDDGKYCCLGVLCEIAKERGLITGYRYKDYAPDETVTRWAFPTSTEVGDHCRNEYLFTTSDTDTLLTQLNDGDHYSFQQIAAVIRREIPREH